MPVENKNRNALTRMLIISALVLVMPALTLYAQADKKFIRQGNKQYEKNKYQESEILYRKATDKNKGSADALFNTGDALYKQKKYDDASRQFDQNNIMYEDKDKKSASLYNMGNSLLMANKLKESIEAYKNSLRVNPDNPEAKYNLAYAQDLLRKQEEQQQQQQDKDKQNQDQDQNKDQDKKDDKNKDQNQDKRQQQDNNQNQNQNQQDMQAQQSISKEDAERLLNAIANDEKNVQEKVKLEKASKAKVKTLKNW